MPLSTKLLIDGTYIVLLAIVALAMPGISSADDGVADGLRKCSLVEDPGARLACFDSLNGRPMPPPKEQQAPGVPVEPADTQVPVKAAGVKAPVEAVAAAATANDTQDAPMLRGRVTRCDKNISDQVVFYLDNGQVWRQSNHKRLSFRNCDFDVTFSKGVLGHTMKLEGGERTVRVRRIK